MLTSHLAVAHVVQTALQKLNVSEQLTSNEVWQHIFIQVFDTPPTGLDDPRWEILLRSDRGLGALHVAMNPDS